MAKQEQLHDIQTIVRLLAPKRVGIVLVPLSSVEEIESAFFWATIFFGIFTAILSALISLCASNFNNTPVLYLLVLFLVCFCILTIVFSINAFNKRRIVREQSLENMEANVEPSVVPRQVDQTFQLAAFLYRFHKDLINKVFIGTVVLPESEFKNKAVALFQGKDKAKGIESVTALAIKSTIVSIDKSNPDNPMYKLNKEFDALDFLKIKDPILKK